MQRVGICPTHVGMNRNDRRVAEIGEHLPHARGDEPTVAREDVFPGPSAPRTWG